MRLFLQGGWGRIIDLEQIGRTKDLGECLKQLPRLVALTSRLRPMPYPNHEDISDSVARQLPRQAQDIYRAAFNHAFAANT
jgi:hypothetical protein